MDFDLIDYFLAAYVIAFLFLALLVCKLKSVDVPNYLSLRF